MNESISLKEEKKVFEHKSEVERWRNKQRQRDRINALISKQELTKPTTSQPDQDQKKSWRKSQKDIGAVLDPESAAAKSKR